jgi:hypothetical protein
LKRRIIVKHAHYQWPWRGSYGITFGTIPLPLSVQEASPKHESSGSERRDDPHLHATRKVIGCLIHATDGEIGHVEDFIVHPGVIIQRAYQNACLGG